MSPVSWLPHKDRCFDERTWRAANVISDARQCSKTMLSANPIDGERCLCPMKKRPHDVKHHLSKQASHILTSCVLKACVFCIQQIKLNPSQHPPPFTINLGGVIGGQKCLISKLSEYQTRWPEGWPRGCGSGSLIRETFPRLRPL